MEYSMEMPASQKKHLRPVLVFDKEGSLGTPLAVNLARERLTVLVSKRIPEKAEQLVVIPLRKQIPKIPNSSFSHFFLVYTGDRHMLSLLPSFIRKAKEDNTQIFFIVSIRQASEALIQKIRGLSEKIVIVFVGDLFGAEWTEHNPVTELLWDAQQGSVLLPHMGLASLYPVHIDDALVVLQALSRHSTTHGVTSLYLLPPHSVTSISFARTLAKHDPDLHIDFNDTYRKHHQSYVPHTYTSVFGSNYSYDHRLLQLPPLLKKPERSLPQPYTSFPIPMLGRWPIILLIGLLSLPILMPLAGAMIGAGLLSHAQTQVKNGQFSKARSAAVSAGHFFRFSQRSAQGVEGFLAGVGLEKQRDSVHSALETGESLSELAVYSVDGISELQRVYLGKSLDPQREFRYGLQNLREAFGVLATLQAEGRLPQEYEQEASSLESAGSVFTKVADVLPHVFGLEGKRTYLVLLQNNMELRPGGGFIGSYGLATFNKGRLENFSIYDVYDADGQLKEHVEPPFQLKRYMGSAHWFLRDSNFDIDFSKNAANAAYFYNLEMKQKVDGVIAIDVSLLRSLLAGFGPIHIPDYNENVTSDNFFLLTETYAQSNFFPGSTQKKDFLAAVYSALSERLKDAHNIKYDVLLSAMATGIREKHVMVSFPEEHVQNVFTVAGMSSSLTDNRPQKQGRVNDFFGVNEANIGGTKSNYYLDRTVHHDVVLNEQGVVSETATITYNNRSKKEHAFGGDYKAYVRVLTPANAQFVSLRIDGQVRETAAAITDPKVFNNKTFVPPQAMEIEQTVAYGKKVFGFLLMVPSGAKKTVALTYTVPTLVTPSSPEIVYDLQIFKQPGTGADPYVFSFTYPQAYRVLKAPETLQQSANTIKMVTDVSQDRDLSVTLTKK